MAPWKMVWITLLWLPFCSSQGFSQTWEVLKTDDSFEESVSTGAVLTADSGYWGKDHDRPLNTGDPGALTVLLELSSYVSPSTNVTPEAKEMYLSFHLIGQAGVNALPELEKEQRTVMVALKFDAGRVHKMPWEIALSYQKEPIENTVYILRGHIAGKTWFPGKRTLEPGARGFAASTG